MSLPCEERHCMDQDSLTCPFGNADWNKHRAIAAIQKEWRQQGPEDERYCDWTRTFVEPWASIAKAIGAR